MCRQLNIRKQSIFFVTLAVFAILAFNGILSSVYTPHENSKERNSAISKTKGITSQVHLVKHVPFVAISHSSYELQVPGAFTVIRFLQDPQSVISPASPICSTRAPPV